MIQSLLGFDRGLVLSGCILYDNQETHDEVQGSIAKQPSVVCRDNMPNSMFIIQASIYLRQVNNKLSNTLVIHLWPAHKKLVCDSVINKAQSGVEFSTATCTTSKHGFGSYLYSG